MDITTSEQIGDLAAALAKAPVVFEKVFWGAVCGWPNYIISDDGTVLSLRRRAPRVMRPMRVGRYLAVTLTRNDGEKRREYIHRLVLEAFDRDCPSGCETRHLNGDPHDNRLINLAWGSRRENHADKKRHGTTARGERNPQAKLTAQQAGEMRCLYASGGWTFQRLAALFGVTAMTAHRAVRRQTWK